YIARFALRHSTTLAACKRYRAEGAEFVIAEHALLEAFSVLSRSPKPIGMPALTARHALYRNFGDAKVAAFRPGAGWAAIDHTLLRGFWGARVYDVAIALSSYEAGAQVLLTWNPRHFLPIAPPGLEIREPR